MEFSEFFLKLFLILVSAKLLGELCAYLGVPAVIGEVLAGVLIGPSLLGFIEPETSFLLLAKIGMLLLLFEVGVDTDVGKLIAVGGQSFMVALTGVALPFAGGYYICYLFFGMPQLTALFVGGTLVATSIGITLRVLKDIGKQHTHEAQVVLGSAVLDDVIGVIILSLLVQQAMNGSMDPLSSVKVLGFIAVFLIAAPVLSRMLVSLMAKASKYSKTSGVLSTIVVSLILILAVLAHDVGAPEIIGAFAAGLALTRVAFFQMGKYMEHLRSEIVARAEEKMTSIGEIFIPVFFVMVGVSINFRVIDFGSSRFWIFAGLITLIAFVSKLASGVWAKGSARDKLAVGVAMAPRGEVGLIFAEVGLRRGIFDDYVYASMVSVVALTTLLAPLMLRWLMKDNKPGAGPGP